jgi:negative regulator of flagellin synthesis FlgM
MKIESSTKPAGAPPIKETRANSASKTSSATNDDVQLSAVSAQLIAADDAQVFDAARVSEIKQAIADGRFTINAGAIADRLIASTKELIDAQRQA